MTARVRGPGADHDRRRAAIVAAVLAVAAERGVAAVSQSAVAAAAGVSPGRVQHYFPAKEDLLAAGLAEANAASSARIAARVGGDLAAAAPRAVLEAVLAELVPYDEATRAHLALRQSYTALALHHEAVADRVREQYRTLHHHDLADLVRREQHDGTVAAHLDPVATAIGLAALAEGLAYYVLIDVTTASAAQQQLSAAVAALEPGTT